VRPLAPARALADRGAAQLDVLSDLQSVRAPDAVQLGPRPGKKGSTVRTPPRARLAAAAAAASASTSGAESAEASSDDDDLVVEGDDQGDFGAPSALPSGDSDGGDLSAQEQMVDLDDSSDLEIEGM
jgi:hypothetical protein